MLWLFDVIQLSVKVYLNTMRLLLKWVGALALPSKEATGVAEGLYRVSYNRLYVLVIDSIVTAHSLSVLHTYVCICTCECSYIFLQFFSFRYLCEWATNN